MNVLLVEDSADDQAILTRLLKDSGIVLSYANTLAGALDALKKEKFNCVLVDPGLPDSVPVDTICQIMHHNPDATAIAYSGSTDPDTVAAAVKCGVHAWLRKGTDDRRAEDVLRVITDAVVRCKGKNGG